MKQKWTSIYKGKPIQFVFIRCGLGVGLCHYVYAFPFTNENISIPFMDLEMNFYAQFITNVIYSYTFGVLFGILTWLFSLKRHPNSDDNQ